MNYKNCDPKYYGSGVKNCLNGIKGLDKLKVKGGEEEKDED